MQERERACVAGVKPIAARSPTAIPQEGPGAVAGRSRTLVSAASLAAWLVYAAIYACVFVLSGLPTGVAIRGAIANALPDGLLALAVIATTRKFAWPSGAGRFPVRHAALAVLFALFAGGLKSLLIWADVRLIRGQDAFTLNGGILAWQIFISLLTCVAVAGASYAQASMQRMRLAAEAAERAEALRVRAELAALRAQLNPHFLFNVLHSVLGLVRRDPPLAERALERLGDLLRYSLHVHREGVDWTTLRDEWEFMLSYLDLEKIRLGERLRVSLDADPAALDRLVPSFLLQPLVENAVRHGIAPRSAGGSVRVRAGLERAVLILQVDNDGDHPSGRPAATGEGALIPSRPVGADRGGPGRESMNGGQAGLGLRLLRDRLAALYGGRAEVSHGATAEGGYSVTLTLPVDGGPHEESDESDVPDLAVREGIE